MGLTAAPAPRSTCGAATTSRSRATHAKPRDRHQGARVAGARSPTCSRCWRCSRRVAGVVFGFSTHLGAATASRCSRSGSTRCCARRRAASPSEGLGLEYALMALSVGLRDRRLARGARAATARAARATGRAREATAARSSTRSRTNTRSTRSTRRPSSSRLLRLAARARRHGSLGRRRHRQRRWRRWPRAPRGSTGAIDHYLVDGAVNFVAEGTLKAGAQAAHGADRPHPVLRVRPPRRGRVLRIIQYFLVK